MASLRIRLRGGEGPPYAQVRSQIERAIERGALLPGDRLPTVRALAAQLGLAPNTIARAYTELDEADWIVGRGRAGTFVAERLPTPPTDAEATLGRAVDDFFRRAAQLGIDAETAAAAVRRRR